MSVNYIDLLLILIVLLSAYYGWYRGFILGLLDLLRWIGSLLLGLRFYQPVARFIAPRFDWGEAWGRRAAPPPPCAVPRAVSEPVGSPCAFPSRWRASSRRASTGPRRGTGPSPSCS